jgi:hypothetical protein
MIERARARAEAGHRDAALVALRARRRSFPQAPPPREAHRAPPLSAHSLRRSIMNSFVNDTFDRLVR